MRNLTFGTAGAIGLAAVVLTITLATPRPAEAFIHEIIAALCRAGGEDVEPPGQSIETSKAFTRALLATGFIASVDTSTPNLVVIHLDPTVPNSKFKSAGTNFVIPNGGGPGVTLVLSPGVIPDPDFAAHAHCRNLNP